MINMNLNDVPECRESGGDTAGGREGQQCGAGAGHPERVEPLYTPQQHRRRAVTHSQPAALPGTQPQLNMLTENALTSKRSQAHPCSMFTSQMIQTPARTTVV